MVGACWPCPRLSAAIGLAATWDADLMHRVSDVISTEARARYNDAIRQGESSRYHGLTFRSPNINIFRALRATPALYGFRLAFCNAHNAHNLA